MLRFSLLKADFGLWSDICANVPVWFMWLQPISPFTRTKFLKVYVMQHKFSLLVQSLTKTRLANTLEACFSLQKEMKLVLIDDSFKDSCRLWAEWNVVPHSKSSISMPHFIWTFRPYSSIESLPGKFMMLCKVLVFPKCLYTWNWVVCSVAHSEKLFMLSFTAC